MTKLLAPFLALACVAGAAEPDRKEFGTIDSGSLIPHYASGSNTFSTEFQIMNLEEAPVPFVMNIFDTNGDPQPLDLRDTDGNLVSTGAVYAGIVPAGGIIRLVTPFAMNENKQGFVEFNTPGIWELGIQAVITSFAGGQPQFRASIPGMGPFQNFVRMPFTEKGGLFSGVAIMSGSDQDVTVLARNNSGVELCRSVIHMGRDTQTAFLLRDQIPCTQGQEGVLEIFSERISLASIGLVFDQQLRMWTSLPFDLCCFDPQ